MAGIFLLHMLRLGVLFRDSTRHSRCAARRMAKRGQLAVKVFAGLRPGGIVMEPYGNRSGNSSVVAYEIADDSITVQFRGGSTYIYNYASTGAAHVDQMKELAISGMGLAGYINRYVRKAYAAKMG